MFCFFELKNKIYILQFHLYFLKVFRAISKDDSKHYAIKVMRSPFRNNARRAMVLEEVRKHELLPEHPNLVGFVSAWEEQDRLFIQTELCTKSLANMCNHDHYISEDRVWKYFIDILFVSFWIVK